MIDMAGETRVLAASMTMEEVFRGTKEFKLEVFTKVQLELNQFGFLIYNANVKQLVDVPGHEYFSYLGQKTQMEAANQAKVDGAEARMKGEIGSKLREGMKGEIGSKLREGQTLQNARGQDRCQHKDYSNAKARRGKEGRDSEIAKINAEAVRGLQPKISVWTNGSGGGDAADGGAMNEVAGVYKMLPPLFTMIQEQTGMLPPPWMGSLTYSGDK
ncbi:hypothetical protein RHMOL_Rhmol07G0191700 [Rhododendron molle]|uniref:Uncharacterized protein n=1 Tax=Rhododendron molle TaxID=49168 RepID=A0ACC0N3J0_RHOML|nr:hypothetical protein RHMOL_Rhmol07G0191700 [Rhododendron molle]